MATATSTVDRETLIWERLLEASSSETSVVIRNRIDLAEDELAIVASSQRWQLMRRLNLLDMIDPEPRPIYDLLQRHPPRSLLAISLGAAWQGYHDIGPATGALEAQPDLDFLSVVGNMDKVEPWRLNKLVMLDIALDAFPPAEWWARCHMPALESIRATAQPRLGVESLLPLLAMPSVKEVDLVGLQLRPSLLEALEELRQTPFERFDVMQCELGATFEEEEEFIDAFEDGFWESTILVAEE